MNTSLAYYFACGLSLIFFTTITLWYAVPWLRKRRRADALMALVAIHGLRNVGLQVYAAQRTGFQISNAARDETAIGDALGMTLAIISLFALRHRSHYAPTLVWLTFIETVIDIATLTIDGARENVIAIMSGTTWLVLVYYLPLIMISLVLTAWQLISRRGEAL